MRPRLAVSYRGSAHLLHLAGQSGVRGDPPGLLSGRAAQGREGVWLGVMGFIPFP